MPVWKEMAGRKFWIGVGATLILSLAVTALGAALAAWGILPPEKSWLWVCAAWGAAALLGGRGAADRAGMAASLASGLAALGLLWLLGLTSEGDGGRSRCLWYAGAVVIGAVLAALPCRKKRRGSGKGKGKGGRK